jgi:hypothetical protein
MKQAMLFFLAFARIVFLSVFVLGALSAVIVAGFCLYDIVTQIEGGFLVMSDRDRLFWLISLEATTFTAMFGGLLYWRAQTWTQKFKLSLN